MTNTVTFHCGDVFEVMRTMADDSVDLAVCSPPFLALRSYLPSDHPLKSKEIGSEATPAAFLDTMLALTAEWRRLVTATGSICVEIGDTYSGSGGGGGDYLEGGMREGQPGFGGSADRQREGNAAHWRQKNADKAGWPLAKSLCGIPTLYTWSLAYGRNLLTGADSPAGRWRVRNLLTWTRPNPPVGALGDKYRPATSFVTVACASDKRWFDLDAVRTEHMHPNATHTLGRVSPTRGDARDPSSKPLENNPAGAPPLDWHHDDIQETTWTTTTSTGSATTTSTPTPGSPFVAPTTPRPPSAPPETPSLTRYENETHDPTADWQPLHRLPTAPYAGSHYAAYPVTLPRRLIESMCPREVCVVCGEARRRIVGDAEYVPSATYRGGAMVADLERKGERVNQWSGNGTQASVVRNAPTLGWTDCGCRVATSSGPSALKYTAYRPGVVLDPFAGSGTTAVAAALCGRDAVLIDLDHRNVDLCRRRLAETMLIVNETVDGNAGTVTWTVRHDMPGTKGEADGQLSMFAEEAS